MTTQGSVDGFLGQRKLAVVGVSRSGRGFGYMAWKALRDQGYDAVPVNPQAEAIDGVPCYHSVRDLPAGVGGVLLVVPPTQTGQVVRDAAAAGITRVWMQQGSGSPEAERFCADNGIQAVSGECILMFAQPQGMHSFHRWIWNLLGKLPKS